MEITDDLVNHISHLARLDFEGEEKVAIKKDLAQIIEFMDKLKNVDTEGVEPLVFMSDEVNRLRADEPVVSMTQEEVLANAPKADSDYFRIPKVLSK